MDYKRSNHPTNHIKEQTTAMKNIIKHSESVLMEV
jgi:hypothetical protein